MDIISGILILHLDIAIIYYYNTGIIIIYYYYLDKH